MIRVMPVLMLCALFMRPVCAAEVTVLGLFAEAAVLRIDGTQRVLKVGQTSPEGVTLMAANADSATFRIGGELRTAPLGDHISMGFEPSRSTEQVTLSRNPGGMYLVPGQINGQSVDMMLDTGATFVSMNRKVARHLGLQYRLQGEPVVLSTANGRTTGYRIKLRNVRVGGIAVEGVDAVVNDGDFPEITLLGMSFLGQLDIEHRQEGTVVLRQTR
ncbi:MAG: TIGR02281 family clan AA aspartic protease [Gammaproteobacteria bacterium]|nr:TIGR02281 family clan AA aspartic protease [Gammaproteobacteria bacterium]